MISLNLHDSVSVLNLIIICLQLKNLENQIEEEYDDKKKLQQEKRDLERQIQELSSKAGSRDKGGSQFLDGEIIVIKTLIRKIDVDCCCLSLSQDIYMCVLLVIKIRQRERGNYNSTV